MYDVLNGLVPADEPGAGRNSNLPSHDRERAPWESSVQSTCECLSWRGALDNLERRHAEDALGEAEYRAVPVHARSAVVTAHLLIDKGLITEVELQAKMAQVRSRLGT